MSNIAPMKVAALQLDIMWEDKRANFERVTRLLEKAPLEANTLLALPEMFATGFSMDAAKIAESYEGETEQFLSRLAKQFGIFVVAGAAMRGPDGHARNKALVFSPAGELIAFYAKMRPFTPGGESSHYAAGKSPVVFRWLELNVAPFVCYDLRFPELFRKAAASDRPEVFVVIASWPDKRAQHWVTLLQARAIENQAYVIGVNRVGKDPYFSYSGRSLMVDPSGNILADAGGDQARIEMTLDLDNLRKYRQGLPFLEDLKA
jgi:omega-amidase